MKKKLGGEYSVKGEYHRQLDDNWIYYPIYLEKMKTVRKLLDKNISKTLRVADLGCGEGVLVEEYRKKGFNIIGIDSNYHSKYVKKGDITNLDFPDNHFDVLLSLDVLEHLDYSEQEMAIAEMKRIINKNGIVVLSIPNLAHFASRFSFLFAGRLIRTSSIERHKGDRPIGEYISIIKKNGFKVNSRKGIFPTLPLISILTFFFPSKVVWLHKLYNKFFSYPPFCFLNILVLKK